MILKNLFLADAAVLSPDNTFSVLRGGINSFTLPAAPAPGTPLPPARMALVGTLELEVTEMGRSHRVEVVLLNADGQRVIPPFQLDFPAPPIGRKGYQNILLDLLVPLPAAGEFSFYVNVDGHELGSLPFFVTAAPAAGR